MEAMIEDRHKAEIIEESSKAKNRFWANISHEMRTPLNVIMGLTDLMLEKEENSAPNLQENLKKISTAANTLLCNIDDFLNNLKVQSGRLELEKLGKFSCAKDKQTVRKKPIRHDLSHAKVLVVDDMQVNLDVATALLGKYKMQLNCVLSGKEAVDLIQLEKPVYNAIFMDYMMPEMDGIETAKAIRNLGTEYARKIPIIALTANAIKGTEEMFYINGFQDFLSKPISIMQLDSVIRRWISPINSG